MKIIVGDIKILTISTFFMLKYVAVIYIGSILPIIFHFDYYNLSERTDLLLKTWGYTTACLFLVPIGMLMVNIITKYKVNEPTATLLSKGIDITPLDSPTITFIILVPLFAISIFVLILYRQQLGFLPIEGVFSGMSAQRLAYLRELSINQFSGKYYRYAIFMVSLPALMLLIIFFLKGNNWKYRLFFYCLLAFNIFVSVISLKKSPLIDLLVLLFVARVFLRNGFFKKDILITAILISSSAIIMYLFFMGDIGREFSDTASGMGRRVFIGQISPFFFYLLYQEKIGYMGMAAFLSNPGGILPFEPIPYTFIIPRSAGLECTMPTVFFGHWFICFGPLMALFSMLIMGLILQSVDIFFISKLGKRKSALLSALFILVIQYMGGFVLTSYSGILIDPKWIMPVFFVILIYISSFILKKSQNTTSQI
jgi:hypothetical protein